LPGQIDGSQTQEKEKQFHNSKEAKNNKTTAEVLVQTTMETKFLVVEA
jgi:hypothetical protein